ncbi:ArfGAP [Cichlidogyrus casuarinus]|uniref:ArfGAP n=1 Tax=Cichlidogyrus casuarinus TaxID=1844966 RepID=A0ABD2Q7P3_9PLAT
MDLKSLFEEESNKICADCKDNNVAHASIGLGVFICDTCAAQTSELHRNSGKKVWALALDVSGSTWSKQSLANFIDTGNNRQVNARLEAELPTYYATPWPEKYGPCPEVIRKTFFNDKYINKVFTQGSIARGLQQRFSAPEKWIVLQKRLRADNQYFDRKFQIIINRNIIQYFINPFADPQQETPKQVIEIDNCDMFFVTSPLHELPQNSAVLLFRKSNEYRFIYLCSSCEQDLVDFYNNLRYARQFRASLNLSGFGMDVDTANEIKTPTHHPLAVSYLYKTGPSSGDAWRRRFCILINRTLFYMARPDDASPKGSIFIGKLEEAAKGKLYGFYPSLPKDWALRGNSNLYPFTLTTPTRSYVFAAESKIELDMWKNAIESILNSELSLTDGKAISHYQPKSFFSKFGSIFSSN